MGRPIGPLLYERGPQGYMLFNLVALALHEVTYKASSNAPAKHIGNKRHPINSSKLIGKRWEFGRYTQPRGALYERLETLC